MCGWPTGLGTWALYLVASAYCIELPVLWNPSMLPLPLALFYVCLLSLATGGALLAALGAGVALAVSCDAHVVCAALVPLFFGVVVATASRPVVATLLAALAALVTSYVSSRGAAVANAPLLAAAKIPCAAVLTGSLGVGLLFRARVRAARPVTRGRALVAGACVYLIAVIMAVSVVTGHPFAPRYFAPIVPPLAILGGAFLAGVSWPGRVTDRRPQSTNAVVLLSTLIVVVALCAPPRGKTTWNAFDAEILATALYPRGWDYPELLRHLRGHEVHALVAALAPYGPSPTGRADPSTHDDLLVLKVARARLPRDVPSAWNLIDLEDSMVAVTRSAPSWMDPSTLQLCGGPPDDAAPHCERVDLGASGAKATFAERAYPTLGLTRRGELATALRPFRWSVEAVLHSFLPARVLEFVDEAPTWRIERVDGLRHEGSLREDEVALEPAPGDGKIVFVVDVPPDSAERFRLWFPSVVETAADETALRSLLLERAP
jgi:hypothetical protein